MKTLSSKVTEDVKQRESERTKKEGPKKLK